MRLRTLELRNYRKYRGYHEIPFSEGILGLLGPNGGGKSTLIEALAWAFYGQAAARSHTEDLRTTGLPPSEPVSVAVEFELSGQNYRVTRSLKGKNLTAEASLLQGDQSLATGAREVSTALINLLGLDWRSFYTTLFTQQKQLAAFSELQPASRRAMIERLLQIDVLDEIARKVRQTDTLMRTRLEDRQTQTRDDEGRLLKDQLQARKEELQESQARLAEQKVDLQRAVVEANNLLVGKEEAFEDLKDRRETHQKLEREQALARSRSEALSKERAQLETQLNDLDQKAQKLKELEPEIKALEATRVELQSMENARVAHQERQLLQRDREQLLQRQKELDHEYAARERELTKLPDPSSQLERLRTHQKENGEERESLRSEHSDLRASILAKEKELSTLTGHLRQIQELDAQGNCPTCERPLLEHQPTLIIKYQRESQTLQEEIAGSKKEQVELEGKIELIESRLQDLQERAVGLTEHQEQRNRLVSRLEEIGVKTDDLKSRLLVLDDRLAKPLEKEFEPQVHQQLSEQVQQLQRTAGTVEELRKQVSKLSGLRKNLQNSKIEATQLETTLKSYTHQIAKVAFDSQHFLKVEGELNQARYKFHQAEKNEIDHNSKVVAIEMKLKENSEKIAVQMDLLNQIKDLDLDSKYHGRLADLFKAFRKHLIGRVAPTLASYTSELLGPLTQGRYTQVQVDPDSYEIMVYDGAEAYSLNRFSGGETDLVNLAFRLSISRLIAERSGADLNLIILDEIFGSQDEHRRFAIMAGLQNLRNRFGQIVLITHIEQVKELVESALRVEETSEGDARVVLA